MSQLWKVVREKELLKLGRRVQIVLQDVLLPDGRRVPDYLRIRTPPFVVVLALVPDGRILCERQYKHGVGRVILTLPAGVIDEGELPLDAAKRELLEETGFVGDEWIPLPQRVMHANAEGAVTYGFVATNCRKMQEPNSGDLEDMAIEALTPSEVLSAFSSGEIPLAGDACALAQGFLKLGLLKEGR